MESRLMTSDELLRLRVLGGKKGTKRIGRVKNLVFHPSEKRCVGLIVKRPDLLWMFHRKDLFVSIQGFDIVDGRIIVRQSSDATDKGACKALGVSWEKCVLWLGMPAQTQDGTSFGCVQTIVIDRETGGIESLETSEGATSGALLGAYSIPASLVCGFKQGFGTELLATDSNGFRVDEDVRGAILLADEAKELSMEGGLAEKGGIAAALAADKVQSTVEKAKPSVDEALRATGEAVNKGAYATGRQIARSKTMFSDFKEEYKKAVGGAGEPEAKTEERPCIESGAAQALPASRRPASQMGNKASTKTQSSSKNMFAAFKEEYDKARKA